MKILVIGSKGFIGSHVYDFFDAKDGYECWGCDVVVDYVDEHYLLVNHINSDFVEIFEKNQFDVCINCAGAASVPDSIRNPLRDFSLNVNNVVHILDAIRKHNAGCRFLNMSSAAVYGNPDTIPIEERSLTRPVSPYGRHKMFAEEICKEYHLFFSAKTCSLRIFSAYGPGLRKQILWDIYQKSRKGNVINLFGTGEETRDFVYIDDIVTAIHLVILSGDFNAGIYNVGSGKQIPIREITSIMLKEIAYEGELFFSGNERTGDPIHWQADISNISKLGYEAQTSINSGIKKYVSWLSEQKLL
jgi:UDP-glucose 4-epimerase